MKSLLEKIRFLLIHRLAYRFSEQFYDWWFGIVSDKELSVAELGLTEPGCHHYIASCYIRFWQMMKLIEIRPGADVFLDIGSGMGRVVVLAARYPFRKVIGVELTEKLHGIAQENVRRTLPRLRCRAIELYRVDARDFRIPPDVTVIYLWSPCSGQVLEQVFSNIRRSVLDSARTVTILYLSLPGVTGLDDIKPRLPWLKERQRVKLGAGSLAVVYTCSAEE
ncbi:MAG: class I SAM-dependent methyltransferase [Verrucomicrobiota bacterium]|jgi:SAM-dependent methyltransferase